MEDHRKFKFKDLNFDDINQFAYRVTSGEILKVILPSGLTASGVVSNTMSSCSLWTLTSTGTQANTTGT